MLQPIITTHRLKLRPPEISDAAAIFQGYAQDPEVTRYLIWRPHRSLAETEDFLRGGIAAWQAGIDLSWVITRLADNAVIGMLAARPDGQHAVSLGYVLARAAWGHGYTTEAVRAVIEAAWARPEIFRVWATCDVDNPASARVMEKAGMQREGRLARHTVHPNVSPEPRDVYLYAITR
jgi:ribosomal-protein-alanine N-acetyltransferase